MVASASKAVSLTGHQRSCQLLKVGCRFQEAPAGQGVASAGLKLVQQEGQPRAHLAQLLHTFGRHGLRRGSGGRAAVEWWCNWAGKAAFRGNRITSPAIIQCARRAARPGFQERCSLACDSACSGPCHLSQVAMYRQQAIRGRCKGDRLVSAKPSPACGTAGPFLHLALLRALRSSSADDQYRSTSGSDAAVRGA